jgi:hypothetical protein
MTERITPRQIVKDLLHGNPPPRPLIVPIVFALGAKIESLPLRTFLDNPTKISNAIRQVRTHLRTDGVSCYFDPHLELEALGVAPQWDAASQTATLLWPDDSRKGELPSGLKSPEDAAASPRLKTAVEVVRRLKVLLRDEPLLLAGVAGPFTLAARLTQLDTSELLRGKEPSEAALEVAAATITKIAAALLEAGANVIFIREELFPPLTQENAQAWASLLGPVFNIARFYEALPVLQLGGEAATSPNVELILQQQLDAIVCIPATAEAIGAAGKIASASLGIAIPAALLEADDTPEGAYAEISNLKPALLTTDGDVPVTTDLKRLMRTFDSISRHT